ncbi:hypothetical protein EJB05_30648 [Eragrostis curvula]|uniref:Uncharacterized protein n=1 Tax=Eragrostis curvula TaxID=38414 RepID=A0A5J9UCE8_9POAL|nr:hypothetical protein EJB05_30648 [Eragrostis curvula]
MSLTRYTSHRSSIESSVQQDDYKQKADAKLQMRIYDVGTTALLTSMPTCPGEPIVAWIVLGRCYRGVAVATHNFGRIGK